MVGSSCGSSTLSAQLKLQIFFTNDLDFLSIKKTYDFHNYFFSIGRFSTDNVRASILRTKIASNRRSSIWKFLKIVRLSWSNLTQVDKKITTFSRILIINTIMPTLIAIFHALVTSLS